VKLRHAVSVQSGTESFETGARIEKACAENKFTDWYVASAKENSNIQEAVNSLIAKMIDNHHAREQAEAIADPQAAKGAKKAPTVTRVDLHEDDGACRIGPRGACAC